MKTLYLSNSVYKDIYNIKHNINISDIQLYCYLIIEKSVDSKYYNLKWFSKLYPYSLLNEVILKHVNFLPGPSFLPLILSVLAAGND
jgi:hypothetical protein